MCFLGSEKYPGENEYKNYLSQHGGRSNASTSMHLTTYKFEILAPYAAHALDVFSQFFVAPLFTKSGTGREVNAVDSENSKNLVSDGRRRLQILKALGDPEHYYTKFSTGNSQTLPTDTDEKLDALRLALLAFHKKHYRPDSLTVVIAGPQSLDELEAWAISGFGPMQAKTFPLVDKNMTPEERLVNKASNDAPPYNWDSQPVAYNTPFHPNKQQSWPYLLTVKPVRSMRKLDLMFPLPPVFANPDRSPIAVLSHLLGHEGPHSSFAALQQEGLLNSLTAGNRTSGPDFSLFHVEIGLTDDGERRWKDVVDVIFQHCRLIARSAQEAVKGKPQEMKRLWGENAKLNGLFFDLASPKSVYSTAPSLCNQVVAYGTEKCLCQGSMLQESEDTAPLSDIAKFASLLVPSNCMMERCSEAAWNEMTENDKGTLKTEQWYGVDYIISDLNNADVKRWEGENSYPQSLALPQPNRYIPRTMELCPDLPEEATQKARIDKEITPPSLIENIQCARLWHRLDDRYALPKSWVSLLIRNAAVENVRSENGTWSYNVTAAIHSSILKSVFDDAMAVETYDAALAGLGFSFSLGSDGVRFTCSGFSDRLSDFAMEIVDSFVSGEFIEEHHFLSVKDQLLRQLKTYFESRRGDSQAVYFRDSLLGSHSLGLDYSIAAVEAATLESVKDHHHNLLTNNEIQLECLYSGNVSEDEAKVLFKSICKSSFSKLTQTPAVPKWIPGAQERRLEVGTSTELHFANKNTHDENGAVVVSFQSPVPGFRGEQLSSTESVYFSAGIRLLCHILREPLFDELRTRQTLGYIVSAYYDIGFATPPQDDLECPSWAVPVDFVVVNVLSRKAPPDVLLQRIDDFLLTFRKTLAKMPASELDDFSSALSTKLLKPYQDLRSEAQAHFAKIRRHAPEVLVSGKDIPWDNSRTLATTMQSLRREDLLKVWDTVMHPRNRARVVSSVYGTTFPLNEARIKVSKNVVVNSMPQLTKVRNTLAYFDTTRSRSKLRFPSLTPVNTAMIVAGVGTLALGITIAIRNRKLAK